MALFEVIELTDDMKKLVASGGDVNAIKAQAKKESMATFQKDGLTAVGAGKTSLEELQRVFQQKT